jgi:hypothetical protein
MTILTEAGIGSTVSVKGKSNSKPTNHVVGSVAMSLGSW